MAIRWRWFFIFRPLSFLIVYVSLRKPQESLTRKQLIYKDFKALL
jgi:hypothetical protein